MKDKQTNAQKLFYKQLKEKGGWYNCESIICKECGDHINASR